MSSCSLTYDDSKPGFGWATGLAGAAPFWVAAVLLWSHSDPVSATRAAAMSIAYGAVVLSFLGGARWGHAVQAGDRLLAVLPGLAGFCAMFLPPVVAIALLIAVFLWQSLWDLISAQDGRLSYQSATNRVAFTSMVVPALLAILGKVVISAI